MFDLSGVLGVWTPRRSLCDRISREIETEFENTLAFISGAQLGLNHEKNGGEKSSDTLPLKGVSWLGKACGVGWSDLARAAKFSFSQNCSDLKYDFFLVSLYIKEQSLIRKFQIKSCLIFLQNSKKLSKRFLICTGED